MLPHARNATVTMCHSHTHDLSRTVRTADIVVAAAGRPHVIQGTDTKPGAVVVDASYNPPESLATSRTWNLKPLMLGHTFGKLRNNEAITKALGPTIWLNSIYLSHTLQFITNVNSFDTLRQFICNRSVRE